MAKKKPDIPQDQLGRYESKRKKRGRPKAKMQPPLTPMIDVTFQLLIFFLLTATFRQAEGQIPGSLPALESDTNRPVVTTDIEPITIKLIAVGETEVTHPTRKWDVIIEILDKRFRLKYDSPREDYNEVARALNQELERRKRSLGENASKQPVIIDPRAYTRWRYAVEVYNQVVEVVFNEVGFAPLGG